jgi:hypothetical protein
MEKHLTRLTWTATQPTEAHGAAHASKTAQPRIPLRLIPRTERKTPSLSSLRTPGRHRDDQLHVLDADKVEPDASTVPEP